MTPRAVMVRVVFMVRSIAEKQNYSKYGLKQRELVVDVPVPGRRG
jgi:hypothetical protein